MKADLLTELKAQMPRFSKGQKKIAAYLIEHFDKAAYLTAAKLGKSADVSESTVVRFASEIGFDGYPQLQQALRDVSRNMLTAVQRMEVASSNIDADDVLHKVLHSDIEKIRKTLEEIDKQTFDKAVDAITDARQIYVIGIGSAAALANFLTFYLNHIFDNVKILGSTSASDVFENIVSIDENDVLVALSFPRYSTRTLKAMHYANEKKAKVIAITDSTMSPLSEFADHLLVARSDMASFVDSLVAPLSLINALIVSIGLRRKDEVSNKLQKLEQFWQEYKVYDDSTDR
ncbi:MAG: MurR/RpiR family transcriptional regulator [Ruminococcaceae bacterium]|nr:MurR/RpiR family transcriptional regulator [Oscillospiraceae bacterium]